MLKNYLLVTFRNLLKNKVFTLINVIGLGLALAVCIVAFFNHMFNYDFNRTNANFREIYRVNCFRDMQGRDQEYGIVPSTLGLQLKQDIPGITRVSRLQRTGSPVKVGNEIFPAQLSFVDPEFLQIFTFTSIIGDTRTIPGTADALLSDKMAHTLFGNENPLGKSISVFNDNSEESIYTVCAVFKDFPENSSFRIDVLLHFDNFLRMWNVNDTDWRLLITALFVQVKDKNSIPSILNSIRDYIPVQNNASRSFRINRFSMVPLKDVGSNSRNIWSSGLFPSLHPAALFAPPIMAIFILLIACFNFANTSIAIFSKRLKEIGLRKTFGGQKHQLVIQFIIEALIICLLALLAGIAFASLLVPAYSSLWAYMSLTLTFTKYKIFWVFLVLILFFTGFISGVYPALHFSAFSPVNVFRGKTLHKGSGRLSIVLLTTQFTISVISLVMGISFARNADYQRTLDLGYDRDKIIVLPVSPGNYTSFRNEILTNPNIIAAEGTVNHIGWGNYRRPVKNSEKQIEVDVLDIGPDYAQTMGLRLKEGRLFVKERADADRSNNSILVNQKLVSDFGWESGVGNYLTLYDTIRLNIIGVVEDFFHSGVWQKIEPTILRISENDEFYIMAVRSQPQNLAGVLEFLSLKWKEMVPNQVFGGQTQEQTMQEEKDINGSILKVCLFLAILATLMSLLGIYNMASLDIIKRTKEVGIRKIHGAPVPILVFLISRKFIFVLLIATLVGCTCGFYMSNLLMDSIWDYFVKIKADVLLLSALIMIVSTMITISVKVIRAAFKNPVEALRYE